MSNKLSTTIRLGTQDDLPFLISSWTQCMKHTYPNQYALDFAQHYSQYVKFLIDKSSTLICHLENEPNEIVSYLVYTSFKNNLIVHYAYTKLAARKEGHVIDLLSFANINNYPIIFSHPAKNENAMSYLSKRWIYDPFIMEAL